MVKIAVLDDFIGNARSSADWSQLPADVTVEFFHEHLSEEVAAEKLRDYEILVSMRERSAFPGSLLRKLPNPKLILGNDRLNPYLDLNTAQELGIKVANSAALPQTSRPQPRARDAALAAPPASSHGV